MSKRIKLGVLIMVLVFGMVMSGCASITWNSPVTETGTVSGMKTQLNNAGAKEIAEYTLILNMFELGRNTFDGLVVAAARAGKKIHILRTYNPFVQKVIAYSVD